MPSSSPQRSLARDSGWLAFAALLAAALPACGGRGLGALGTEGHGCTAAGTCDPGLSCFSRLCVRYDGGASAAGGNDGGSTGTGGRGIGGNGTGGNGTGGRGTGDGDPPSDAGGDLDAAPDLPRPPDAPPATQLSFAPAVKYATGAQAWDLAIVDLNRDGRRDVVVINLLAATASVLLGSGNGAFAAAINSPTAPGASNGALADFTGDGRYELAIGLEQSGVVILPGRADGTSFGPSAALIPGSPRTMTVADLNADGRDDLVFNDLDTEQVAVALGNGNGTFRTPVTYAAVNTIYGAGVADFDRDGKLDVVVTGGEQAGVLLGNGDGTLRAVTSWAGGTGNLAIGDFNRDGAPDVATCSYPGNQVNVLLGNGDGTLRARVRYPVGDGENIVAVGDLDSDGALDLVETNYRDSDLGVLLGNGDGTFRDMRRLDTGKAGRWVAVADFDGNGRPDLAVTNSDEGNLSVLLNTSH